MTNDKNLEALGMRVRQPEGPPGAVGKRPTEFIQNIARYTPIRIGIAKRVKEKNGRTTKRWEIRPV